MSSEFEKNNPKLTKKERRRVQAKQAYGQQLIGRRTFIRNGIFWLTGAGLAVSGGIALLNHLGKNGANEGARIAPTAVKTSTSVGTSWSELSPLERIKRLELLRTPTTPNFNPVVELIIATAEFYFQQVPTEKTPTQLQNNVLLLSPEQYLDALIRTKPEGSSETEADTRKFAETSAEFVDQVDRIVHVNSRVIDRLVQANAERPEIKRLLEGRDARIVLLKTVFFHGYSHSSVSNEEIEIGSIELAPLPGRPVVNKIKNFNLVGTYPDGRSFMYTGVNEALTEYAARLVSQETGLAFGFPAYLDGVELVEMANKRANLPPVEFKEIYTGRRSAEELLQRWGGIKNTTNPDRTGALMALITMGIRLNNPELISQQRASSFIREQLGF